LPIKIFACDFSGNQIIIDFAFVFFLRYFWLGASKRHVLTKNADGILIPALCRLFVPFSGSGVAAILETRLCVI